MDSRLDRSFSDVYLWQVISGDFTVREVACPCCQGKGYVDENSGGYTCSLRQPLFVAIPFCFTSLVFLNVANLSARQLRGQFEVNLGSS